jgi:hypothetical protein
MKTANITAFTPLSISTPTWLMITAASSEPATPPSWNLPKVILPRAYPTASDRNSADSGDFWKMACNQSIGTSCKA